MILLEAVSLLAFKFPAISLPLLLGIGAATFVISLKNLEWGIYLLFGELFIGSRGRLLEYDLISLRMVVFAAVMGAWIVRSIRSGKLWFDLSLSLPRPGEGLREGSKLRYLYLLLLLVIGLGILNGAFSNNGLKNVFQDANGYLYLLILPAVLAGTKTREALENLFKILAAAILLVGAKTLVLFLWFAFGWPGVATLYHWVINRDIGEITGIVGSASRIFMQSQFYALAGLFIFSLLYFDLSRSATTLGAPQKPRSDFRGNPDLPRPGEGLGERSNRRSFIVTSAAVLAIILSLSRSLWLGGFAAAIFADLVLIFYLKVKLKSVIKWGFAVLGIAVLEVALLFGLMQVGGAGWSESVASRGLNPASEAAGGARLLLLPELLSGIKENPLMGKGFGEEVTYKSYLPDRITAKNPEGEIASFAFEWGYLDMLLKFGALGLIVYLLFIAHIFRQGWAGLKNEEFRMQNLGILSGLVALVVLNVTTPYLNHPLGIGYLILAIVSFRIISTAIPTFSPPHEGEIERGS